MHAAQSCSECHKSGLYRGTSRDCFGCHKTNYDQTKNPNHAAAGFPTTCETCHKPTDASFNQGSFNHGAAFQLVGQHGSRPCSACHVSGIYKGTSRDCFGCHKANYDQTKNPNHPAAGFPTTCEVCHKPSDASFNQGSFNGAAFQLVGQHASRPCSACHVNGIYRGTPNTCFGCHKPNYDKTTNPNHPAAGFPMTCEVCHKPSDASFNQGRFNHGPAFQLVGPACVPALRRLPRQRDYRGTPNCRSRPPQAELRQDDESEPSGGRLLTTCEACSSSHGFVLFQGTFNHTYFGCGWKQCLFLARIRRRIGLLPPAPPARPAARRDSHHSGVMGMSSIRPIVTAAIHKGGDNERITSEFWEPSDGSFGGGRREPFNGRICFMRPGRARLTIRERRLVY